MWNPFQYFKLPASFLTTFLHSQFTTLPYPDHSFAGQTIIVTGANTGLGLSAAQHFVRLGATRVILACRSLERGFDAKKSILHSFAARPESIEVWEVDVGNWESVKAFCAKVKGLERLDVLVENAGVGLPKFERVAGTSVKGVDGLEEDVEKTIAVNVIGTFLMALLVLPTLSESARKWDILPRLVVVASDAHEQASFKEQDASSIFTALASPTNQFDRYNVSKLIEILVIRSLAQAMTDSAKASDAPTVVLNTLTPGFCHSELMRHATFPLNLLGWVGKRLIGRTTEMGSRTLVAAACAGEESHGTYMTDCKVGEVSPWVRSEKGQKTQEKVYRELLALLDGIENGIAGNI